MRSPSPLRPVGPAETRRPLDHTDSPLFPPHPILPPRTVPKRAFCRNSAGIPTRNPGPASR